MNISINTYLIKKCNDESDFLFVHIDDIDRYQMDSDYVEGAIEITVDSIHLFDKTMWDLVDQLWMYLVDSLNVLLESGKSEFLFPDQPIRVSMQINGANIVIKTNPAGIERVIVVDRKEFCDVLLGKAVDTFMRLQKVNPSSEGVYGRYVVVANNLLKECR